MMRSPDNIKQQLNGEEEEKEEKEATSIFKSKLFFPTTSIFKDISKKEERE